MKRQSSILLIVLVTLAFILPVRAATQWEYIYRNGVRYVPMSQVRTFCGLSGEKRSGGSYEYSNKKLVISMSPGKQEMKMNHMRFMLSYPIAMDSTKGLLVSAMDVAKIISPVLRPIYEKTYSTPRLVILDPGHGAHDAGACNRLYREKDLALSIAKKVKAVLTSVGIPVVMTRDTDVFLTLQERVNVANRYKDALFVSIHCNSGGSSASGIEIFTLAPVGTRTFSSVTVRRDPLQGNAQDGANIALATAIQGMFLSPNGEMVRVMRAAPIDRGVKRARFSVLCTIQHPAVLVECGFMSNEREGRLLGTPEYQNVVAKTISQGIMKYRAVMLNRLNRVAQQAAR